MPLFSTGHNIYYASDPRDAAQRVVTINGHRYERFLDFIYLPAPADQLTTEQTIDVNMLRHRYRRNVNMAPNDHIGTILREAVELLGPSGAIIEFGCGFSPLFPPDGRFVCVDLNDIAITTLRGRGYDARLFDLTTTLDIEDLSASVVVARFVLHFAVSAWQIDEMYRVLGSDGCFVGNVYRRSRQGTLSLQTQFERAGFNVQRLSLGGGTRRPQQLWVCGKSPLRTTTCARVVRDLILKADRA